MRSLAVVAALLLAAEWIVDDDGPASFRTIQQAIDAVYVHSGDTILVRAGTYRETVYLSGKDLVIRSERGPLRTTLDAGRSGSAISLVNRSGATRIEGFTIRNGSDQTGGGVWVLGGALSLFGALALAELGAAYPESGGMYVYLREAYGPLVAFLFGWTSFLVIEGGGIATVRVDDDIAFADIAAI